MAVKTFEGVVKKGLIRLPADLRLPDNTRVYVVVPDAEDVQKAHVLSPRLAHSEQAADFKKEVVEVAPDASV